VLDALVAQMKSPVEAERRDAARRLATLGADAERALEPLLGCLHDQAWSVRAAAVESLCRLATAGAGLAWVDRLFGILRDPDARVRNSAVTVLSRIGPSVIPVLTGALSSPDPDTGRYAADVLGDLGDRHAVLPLVAALAHPSDEVKYYAMVALGKLRDARAVTALVRQLDGDMWLQSAAVEALGAIGDRQATAPLIALLGRAGFLAPAIAEALGRIADPSALPALLGLVAGAGRVGSGGEPAGSAETRRAALAAAARILPRDGGASRGQADPAARSAVAAALGEPATRGAAALVASRLGMPEAIPALADLVAAADVADMDGVGDGDAGDADDGSRAAAAELATLARLRPDGPAARAIETLLASGTAAARRLAAWMAGEAALVGCLPRLATLAAPDAGMDGDGLEPADDDLRTEAVRALGRLAAPAALDALLPRLDDPVERVRQAAVDAVAACGQLPGVADQLLARLDEPDGTEVRSAIEALSRIHDRRAVEPLKRLLYAARPEVRQAAVFALAVFDEDAVGSLPLMLLGSEDPVLRRSAATVLGELGDSRALEPLRLTLRDADPWVRYEAARAIAALGDRRGGSSLREALADRVGAVRLAAARGLGELRDQAALDPLLALAGDADEDVREAAIEAAGRLTGETVLPALLEALRDGSWKVRAAAAEALGRRGETAAQDALAALSDDPHPSVRRAAETALDRTGRRS
jgi:HEAT repeat protein